MSLKNQNSVLARERNMVKCARVFYYNAKKFFLLTVTIVVFFLVIFIFPKAVSAFGTYDNPDPVSIGSASDFIILGKDGITSDSLTTYAGNIGVSPGFASGLTGVTCANITSGRMYTTTAPGGPAGCVTTAGTVTADNFKLSAATSDFDDAYDDAINQTTHPFNETAGSVNVSAAGIKGRGVYNYTDTVSMDTDLILQGSDTDI
jgi:hypothetical protein